MNIQFLRYLLIIFLICSQNFLTAQVVDTSEPTLLPYTEQVSPTVETGTKDVENFQAKFLNMLLMLGLLIGLMIFASFFIKRLTKSRIEQLNQTSEIRLLETRYLSQKSTLYLLEVQGQGILIGESHQGLISLGKILLHKDEYEPESAELNTLKK